MRTNSPARRAASAIAGISLLTAAVAGCGGSGGKSSRPSASGDTASVAPVAGGTLTVGGLADVTSFIPGDTADLPSAYIATLIYDTLFVPGADGNSTQPSLATAFAYSNANKTATITLREGVTFSNGKAFGPDDVVFSIEQLTKSAVLGTFFSAVKSATASGPSEVTVQLSRPESDFQALLSAPVSAILPAGFAGESKTAFAAKPIGTGPFTLKSRKAGSEIDFVKNAHYWRSGKPHLNGVTYQVFSDANALSSAMQAGSVDFAQDIPASAVQAFSGDHILYVTPSPKMESLVVNGKDGVLANPKVRLAISHAIDRATMVKSLFGGHGQAADGLSQPAGRPADTNTDSAPFSYDTALAKSLLADAGVSKPTLDLTYNSATDDALVAQVIASDLSKVGITIKLKGVDAATAIGAIVTGKAQLGLLQPTVIFPAVTIMLGFIATNGYTGAWPGANVQPFQDAYAASTDPAAQATAVEGFEHYVATTMPIVPLYSASPAYAIADNVHGVTVTPTLYIDTSEIFKK